MGMNNLIKHIGNEKITNLFAGAVNVRLSKDEEGYLINPSASRLAKWNDNDKTDIVYIAPSQLTYGIGITTDTETEEFTIVNYDNTAYKEGSSVCKRYSYPISGEPTKYELLRLRICVETIEPIKITVKGEVKTITGKFVLPFMFYNNIYSFRASKNKDKDSQPIKPALVFMNAVGNIFTRENKEIEQANLLNQTYKFNTISNENDYGYVHPVYLNQSEDNAGFIDLIYLLNSILRIDRLNANHIKNDNITIYDESFFEAIDSGNIDSITSSISDIVNLAEELLTEKFKDEHEPLNGLMEPTINVCMCAKYNKSNSTLAQSFYSFAHSFNNKDYNNPIPVYLRKLKRSSYVSPVTNMVYNHATKGIYFGGDNTSIPEVLQSIDEVQALTYFKDAEQGIVKTSTNSKSNSIPKAPSSGASNPFANIG